MDTPYVNGWAKEDACNNGKKLIKMYPKYSKKAFDKIVTGDETWVYYFEPKRKGPAIQIPVPKGRTVTGKFYINVVLRKLKN